MVTWTAVVTAAPYPGVRTITFIDGPPEPPIGTKIRVEPTGEQVLLTETETTNE